MKPTWQENGAVGFLACGVGVALAWISVTALCAWIDWVCGAVGQ